MPSVFLRTLALPALFAAATTAAAHSDAITLGAAKIAIADGAKRRVAFSASWKGVLSPAPDPTKSGSTLRVTGSPTGDTGIIRLVPGAWERLGNGNGWRYDDPTQAAGGIRSILLKVTKKGGRINVRGGGAGWPLGLECMPDTSTFTLRLGAQKFSGEVKKPKLRRGKGKKAGGGTQFASTFDAIQKQIFEGKGCTAGGCHSSGGPSGGLDLTAGVAYQNLVGVPSPTFGTERVRPGGKQDSFLWQKLAAGRGELDLQGRGSPMPIGREPLSQAELELVGRWIHDGARQEGVVPGTTTAVGSCLPPVEPPTIVPPAKPAPGTGIQFFAPPWTIEPPGMPAADGLAYGDNGEDEVCYATYFDLRRDGDGDGLPDLPPGKMIDCPPYWQSRTNPTGKCYAFDHQELTQEPNSHHSIIHIYRGGFDVADPGFAFRCHAGETPGQPCDPRAAGACPAGQECRGAVKSSLACLTYGPADYTDISAVAGSGAANSPSVGGSQQPFLRRELPEGVFGVFPVEGVMIWNSHAFNVWDDPVQNQQWYNVWFVDPANPDETRYNIRGIFDATDIFVQNVPPFEEREYCRTVTFGRGTRLFELSSHNHRFGRLFRVFAPPMAESCSSAEGPCVAAGTDPILVTTEYNDPAQVTVGPSAPFHALDDPDPAKRRFKFCALYDNGKSDPQTVKRNSTSPTPPTFGTLAPGGPCFYTFGETQVDEGIACLNEPNKGKPCGGDHDVCDSAPGKGDGVCDACPVQGGVTTEDEMFILIGAYYCDTSVPDESCTGVCASGPRAGEACHGNDTECPGPEGACNTVNGRCATGPRRGQACASDAECPRDCVPYTN